MRSFKIGIIREVRKDLTRFGETGKTNLAWCTDGWKLVNVILPSPMTIDEAEDYCVGKNFLEV